MFALQYKYCFHTSFFYYLSGNDVIFSHIVTWEKANFSYTISYVLLNWPLVSLFRCFLHTLPSPESSVFPQLSGTCFHTKTPRGSSRENSKSLRKSYLYQKWSRVFILGGMLLEVLTPLQLAVVTITFFRQLGFFQMFLSNQISQHLPTMYWDKVSSGA